MWLEVEMGSEQMWLLWEVLKGVEGLEEVRAQVRERLAEWEDEQEWMNKGPKVDHEPLTEEEGKRLHESMKEAMDRAVTRFLGVRDPIWGAMNNPKIGE